MKVNSIKRLGMHLYKSGCLLIGLEHFLVMFPSVMLIARLANTAYGSIVELPSVLLACGIGTLTFLLLTKRHIPFLLGPSFSYIGFVSYQVAQIASQNDIEAIRSTIYYGYFIAGIILLVLCWLYRFDKTKKVITTLFPSTIMGPSISLIGLELASMAAQDSGFIGGNGEAQFLALITLACIIVFSLLRHHFLQNASILIGVLVGCVVAYFMGYLTLPTGLRFKLLIPEFYVSSLKHPPHQWITLVLAILPCTLIAFVESLGRLAVYEGMLRRDQQTIDVQTSNSAISYHACTSILTSITSMMPSAIYAENLAIMNLHSADLSTKYTLSEQDNHFVENCYAPYSIYPYVIASLISIIVATCSGLQEVFLTIPMPILGGMELFVFGLISAPGIQMLVDQQVNYKKISNQIITASVLLAGVSNISITYGSLTLRGMSLGLTVGVIVNIITLLLGYFGYLNEKFSLPEVMDACISSFGKSVSFCLYSKEGKLLFGKELASDDFGRYIRRKHIGKILKESYQIKLQDVKTKRTIELFQQYGRVDLKILLAKMDKNTFINDHPKITVVENSGRTITFILDEYVSMRLLTDILKKAQ